MTAKEYLSQAKYLDMRINSKIQQVSSLNDLAKKCTTALTETSALMTGWCSMHMNIVSRRPKMKTEITRIAVCPKCGQTYIGHPALSRTDNETLICSDCGTREALESIGVAAEEQEQIIATIHRCSR